MMRTVLLLACLCFGVATAASKKWAVLVAGSNTWDNYRHQADVCHAYQILVKNGVPPEQIITFMYDDIARNRENPTPGVIINKPGGSDVYKGVQIDYKGEDVTVENFLNAMTGVQKGKNKVLQSGPDDHVFVNLVDHGAPGIFAFPSEELTSKQLIKALTTMADKKMFAQLVFYLEACESGSMFDGLLPKNVTIFATTASSPDESSYACYFDSKRETYLGDVYSVNWMEDSDRGLLKTESLQQQFTVTKKLTNTSTVEEYGDMSFNKEVIGEFQGNVDTATGYQPTEYVPITDAVRSDDVKLEILYFRREKAMRANDVTKVREVESEIAREKAERLGVDDLYMQMITRIVGNAGAAHAIMEDANRYNTQIDFDCYEPALESLRACFPHLGNSYAARRLYTMVTLCHFGYSARELTTAIDSVCAVEQVRAQSGTTL